MPSEDKKVKILAVLAVILLVVASITKADKVKIDESIPEIMVEKEPAQVLEMDPSAIVSDISQTEEKSPQKSVPKPLISAEAYLVANLETGEIYAEHNKKSVFPIASISKLVTAIIADKNIPKDKEITITDSMLEAYGDAGHLASGEIFHMDELLPAMLLESSNDAAEALAQSADYESFIANMNSFVREIGMNSTSFGDASGLSSKNTSNTEDLFVLAKYLYNNEKKLLEISKQGSVELLASDKRRPHVFSTINPFSGDPNFIGGKTGRTDEARESMLSLFSYKSKDRIYPIAIIVLRSDFSTREIDSSILFEQAIKKIGL